MVINILRNMELFTFCVFVLLFVIVIISDSQLIVNVRNNGGDVYRETIEANTTSDSISLDFRKSDGTIVTQFIDGRNEVQVFRAVILPEEVLGQTEIQTVCFVLRFAKNEFISSDAMSKLRQKNPSTIRHPEEVRSLETFEMDVLLNVAASHIISSHIGQLCADATTLTYARTSDLRLLSQILNRDYSILQTITRQVPTVNQTSCANARLGSRHPCVCHYDICIGWYPCGLKYCRGRDSTGRIVSYRCGIKTCSRCRQFEFLAGSKSFCVWDEPDFQPLDYPSQHSPDDVHKFHWKDDGSLAARPGLPRGGNFHWKAGGRNSPGGGVGNIDQHHHKLTQLHRGDGGPMAKSTKRDDDDDDD